MNAVEIIDRKRRGEILSREEIEWFVLGYSRGNIPDYQVSSWLMAVCCRGLTRRETLDLTASMVASGTTIDMSGAGLPVADKHSSGGVGDKTSIVVAPLVRACGVAIAKMSGRGLGFTGGTIDKLESIPGFRTDLSIQQFTSQLKRKGIVLSGQTPELVPADGKLYALRDVTATVQCIPLIASSIMSKKLAVGAQALVLDVKVGSGAFMETLEEARELASLMVDIGAAAGKRITALLTAMDQPLGRAVGNALEVEEAIQTLRGTGPDDLTSLSLELTGELLFLAGRASSALEGRALAQAALESGEGLEWFRKLVAVQGGDPRVADEPEIMGKAPMADIVLSPSSGWVIHVDARSVARAALCLGAGRTRKGEPIDRSAGIL